MNYQKFLRFQLSKISSISMEGKHLRVLVSVFRSGSSTSDFYKIIKDSHCSFGADSHQNNHGRHVADESDCERSRNSQGYIDFSIAASRLCNKSTEICSGALAEDRVSRSGNRLGENDISTITGKSKKIETEMLKAYFKPQTTLWEVTNLLGSHCSTAQAVLPAVLQTGFYNNSK